MNAPATLDALWDPHEAADAAVSFARGYAAVVEADWTLFVSARNEVSKKLGL